MYLKRSPTRQKQVHNDEVGHFPPEWEIQAIELLPMAKKRRTRKEAIPFGKRRPDGVQDGIGVRGDVGIIRWNHRGTQFALFI